MGPVSLLPLAPLLVENVISREYIVEDIIYSGLDDLGPVFLVK